MTLDVSAISFPDLEILPETMLESDSSRAMERQCVEGFVFEELPFFCKATASVNSLKILFFSFK